MRFRLFRNRAAEIVALELVAATGAGPGLDAVCENGKVKLQPHSDNAVDQRRAATFMDQFAWADVVVAEISAVPVKGMRLKILSFKYSTTYNLCETKYSLQSQANRRAGSAVGERFTA
ncbi:MAG: hypothetical protein ACSHXI_01055 [Hoeflea sp.]|uniref:hypothetical protein n=1 Tax=Hoeflea sp. TaxID=1940281 RepID=UPI003EF100DE